MALRSFHASYMVVTHSHMFNDFFKCLTLISRFHAEGYPGTVAMFNDIDIHSNNLSVNSDDVIRSQFSNGVRANFGTKVLRTRRPDILPYRMVAITMA